MMHSSISVDAPSDDGDPTQATPFSENSAVDASLRKKRDRPLSGRLLPEEDSPLRPVRELYRHRKLWQKFLFF